MTPPRLGVWPTLPLDVHLRGRSGVMPFPLGLPECRLYSRARHALWSACGAIGLRAGDEVVAPAYHHGSEIEALMRAGLRIRFFDVTEDLEPDPSAVDRTLRPTVRALYLIHYLGFPQDTARWRAWCNERGLLLLEDAAQAWLATRDGLPVGSLGDLAIFCLYKTIGLPDGAALISRHPPDPLRSRPRVGLPELIRRHGAWMAQRGGVTTATLTRLSNVHAHSEHHRSGQVDREFDLGQPQPPSWATSWLLPRALDPTIADRRRSNYGLLLDQLSAVVPPAFRPLPAGASPFAFPIRTGDSAATVEALEARGVKALLLWKHPHPSLAVPEFPVAHRYRDTVVALPVHQGLRESHLERIADAVKSTLGHG